MSIADWVAKAIGVLPSPEGCGCKARKEAMQAWLRSK